MKKSKTMRAASFLLVLTLMTSCFVGSTFAKYTSTASGSATATVAKWSIEVNNTQIAVTGTPETVPFNLFDTINDTGNTADETDVKDNLIAPGTAGSFALTVENLSEVNAIYTIQLAENNDNAIPLQYSVNGTDWTDSIAELTTTELTNQNISMGTGSATKTVYWKWGFNGGHAGQTDAYDTALGIAARTSAPTVTITATITVEQID